VTAADVGADDGGLALADLAAAMETACALAADLDFVVAPVRARDGQVLIRLGPRYAITVFPYRDGVPGDFGDLQSDAERATVIGMLARLHAALAEFRAPHIRTADTGVSWAGFGSCLHDLTAGMG
jgi:spectinomycin phosphotransferase